MNIRKNEISFEVIGNNAGFFNHYSDNTWEPYTFEILEKFLDKDSIYFDVGAWIGITCIPASFYANACYAFEPDPQAYDELKQNVNQNEFSNIHIFNNAVVNYTGQLSLGNPNQLGNSMTRLYHEENSFLIDCVDLNTFCETNDISKVDFIKIDVEGSEELILKDISFFEKFKPTIYLSLHPFWFVSPEETYLSLKKLTDIYGNLYNVQLEKIDLDVNYTGLGDGCLLISE